MNYWNYVEEEEDRVEVLRHVETTLYRLLPGASSLPMFTVDARKTQDKGVLDLKQFLKERVSSSLQRGKKIVSAYSESMRISANFREALKTEGNKLRERLQKLEFELEQEQNKAENEKVRYKLDLRKDRERVEKQILALENALEAQQSRVTNLIFQKLKNVFKTEL